MTVWIARAASVIGPALAAASSVGSSASRAAKPSAALRVGTTATVRSRHRRDLARGEDHVRVVGQEQDLAGVDALDRLEQLTGARVRALAALHDRRDAEVVEDRREALAGDDRDDPERQRRARGARRPRAVPVRMDGPARVGGELGRPGLAHVAGLVVEVLDADLAQGALGQPEPDDVVGPLVVDVDLERTGVARDEHGFADRTRGSRGSRPRRAAGRGRPGGGTSSRSRTPRPHAATRVDGAGPTRAGARAAVAGRLPDQVQQRALEEPVDALAAGIHDPRLAQDRPGGSASARPTSRRHRPSRSGR